MNVLQDLSTLTVAVLTSLHNEIVAEDGDEIGKWSQSKAKLIDRIRDCDGYVRPTIRALAEALLLEVAFTNEDERNVGLTYDVILERIHEAFPEGETSVKCLRWYAVKMKEDENVLPLMPIRPRKQVAKAA